MLSVGDSIYLIFFFLTEEGKIDIKATSGCPYVGEHITSALTGAAASGTTFFATATNFHVGCVAGRLDPKAGLRNTKE